MARYATTEKLYECPACYIVCARREMTESCHTLYCPNCSHTFFQMDSPYPSDEILSPIAGVMVFKWQGNGEIKTPAITVEEDRISPQECDSCRQIELVRTRKKINALKRVGLTVGKPMHGADICRGGSQVVIPMCSIDRLWINDEEIDISLYEVAGNVGTWEYPLQNQ